jgi:cytochrome c biogenesis protein CcmG, thiol:disulfide interchange protein DsbE
MRRRLFLIPSIAFIVVAVFFLRSLHAPAPHVVRSPLIGRPAPLVALPALDGATKRFTSADLSAGHVSVVNVWASWCVPCRAEAAELADISRSGSAELYGIVYEDNPAAAREFLRETGDPFARLDLDADGREGAAWGIYGVPETFVIDRKGIVRLRYAGPIVPDALANIIVPAITTAARES